MGLYLETLQLFNFIQLKLLSLSSSLLFSTISFYAFEKQLKTVKTSIFCIKSPSSYHWNSFKFKITKFRQIFIEPIVFKLKKQMFYAGFHLLPVLFPSHLRFYSKI